MRTGILRIEQLLLYVIVRKHNLLFNFFIDIALVPPSLTPLNHFQRHGLVTWSLGWLCSDMPHQFSALQSPHEKPPYDTRFREVSGGSSGLWSVVYHLDFSPGGRS